MSVKTPNYMLTEEVRFINYGETKTIPKGAFVRPIELKYVPKHVLDSPNNRFFNSATEVFAFTRYGIVAIPKSSIREA
jgi:hypothetical protein